MSPSTALDLEDFVTALYAALDDALAEARVPCVEGKLIPRRGPPPEVDDREILCLAVLQELLHFESDNRFFWWLDCNPIMQQLFPRRLSRQKFAERRALLTPLLQRLCQAFCALGGEAAPPFSSLTPTPSRSAASSARGSVSASTVWPPPVTALPRRPTSMVCANT